MTIYIPENAEFFIAIRTGLTAGIHSSIVSGVIINDEIIPLLNIGRVLNGRPRKYLMSHHKTTIFASENFQNPSMSYEAYSISKEQYQALLKRVTYISDNQPLRYNYRLLSTEDFEEIQAPCKKGIYFSVNEETRELRYKFVTYRGTFIEGTLDGSVDAEDEETSLRELAKRVLTKEVDVLLGYRCRFQKPLTYQKSIKNPNQVRKSSLYFSYPEENKFLLRYRFRIGEEIICGSIDLTEPFSKNRLKEYQKRVIAEQFNLLGAYKISDEGTLEYDILRQDDNDQEEAEEAALAQMTGKITPLNNCRTSALAISEPVLGFKPKASRNFLKKLPYRVSTKDGKIDSHSFYVLPQPPQLFESLLEEQQEILETLHKRLRKIPKINPTSEATRKKFDALKQMYVDIAGKPQASAEDLLQIFDAYEEEQYDTLFRARSFFTENFSRIKKTSTESCFLECRSRLAPAH